jgi:hypothetical protein
MTLLCVDVIAVNERLGCRVVAHHQGFRRAV